MALYIKNSTKRAPLLPAPDHKPQILGPKIEEFSFLVHLVNCM